VRLALALLVLLAEPATAQVLAFTGGQAGSADVWLFDIATGQKRRLTTDPARETQPAWSFDGQTIAYSRGGDVWTMRADGSGQTNRTRSPGVLEWFPFWLPDGRLGFSVNRGDQTTEELYVLGPGDVPLPLGLRGRYAAVSEDGARICFTQFDGTVRDVVVQRLPTGRQVRLAVNGAPAHSCAWSPFQPQRLVFHSHHALPGEPRGNGRHWLADTTGWIGTQPFTQGPPLDGNQFDLNSGDFQPAWHRSGWLVWSRPVGCDPFPPRCGEQPWKRELFAKFLNGPEIRLTRNTFEDWYPAFRP
jgi:hypothetical protein